MYKNPRPTYRHSLQYLVIAYYHKIVDFLKAIAKHLHSLEYLDLKDCPNISQKIVDVLFPDLEIFGRVKIF
jgi:hypothetical protein